MSDHIVGQWRDRKGLSALIGLTAAVGTTAASALVLYGVMNPEAANGQWLPLSAGLQDMVAWAKSAIPYFSRDWKDALWTLNQYGIAHSVVWRAQASIVLGFVAGAAGWVRALPFADEYRVRMRHVRGLVLVQKPYPAARAARRGFADQIEGKWKRLGLYISIAPDVLIGWKHEVQGCLALGAPGSGKTVWIQYMINQILARSNHLAEMLAKLELTMTREMALEKMPLFPDKCMLVDIKGDFTSKFPTNDFVVLAPHDTGLRKGERIGYAWDIGKDIVGLPAAQDFAAAMIEVPDKDPTWSRGARIILTAFIRSLQISKGTRWGWKELADVMNLTPQEQRDLVAPVDMKAAAYYIFEQGGGLTNYSGSFVNIISSSIAVTVDSLAMAWGDYAPEHRVSVTEWLLDPCPKKRFLILQMSGQVETVSVAWVRSFIARLSSFTKSPELPESDKRRVWLICDEAPQYFGKDDGFLKTIEVGRSKGFCAIVAAQVDAQFDKVWSESEYKTLEAMMGIKWIFMTRLGVVTKHLAEDVVGSSDWRRLNRSRNVGKDAGGSVSREDVRELVVMPNWFVQSLKMVKNKGLQAAFVGEGHLCRLLIPFQVNWAGKQREPTVLAPWVKSNQILAPSGGGGERGLFEPPTVNGAPDGGGGGPQHSGGTAEVGGGQVFAKVDIVQVPADRVQAVQGMAKPLTTGGRARAEALTQFFDS